MWPLCGRDGDPGGGRYHWREPLMTAPSADDPPRAPAAEPPDGAGPADAGPPEETASEPRPAARRRIFRRRAPALPAPGAEGGETPGAAALRRRRRALTLQRQEAVYHLGGLAFELYRRDRLPAGVMRRRAAEVAEIDRTVGEIDAWLEEIDRLRRERKEARRRPAAPASAEVGCCLRCRATFVAEARFCSRCGVAFGPGAAILAEEVTQVIAEGRGAR
jgi:hypothetical protein